MANPRLPVQTAQPPRAISDWLRAISDPLRAMSDPLRAMSDPLRAMSDPPGTPGGGGSDPGPDREGELATRTRQRVARPPRFKVVLYNDDYTPMEFVVTLLETVFKRSPAEATQLMLQIHNKGAGIAGVYVLEVAETKVATVHRLAEERGYPLRAGAEEE